MMIDANGQKIPLSYIADVRSVTGPNTINRENVQRKIVISGNVSGRDLRGVVNDIQKKVDASVKLPEGYHEIGLKVMVLGSGTARNIPEGFSRDEAVKQFTELCRQLAKVAEQYNVVIAIEPLQHSETNFINTVSEGADIARAVNNSHLGVLADFFHMHALFITSLLNYSVCCSSMEILQV